MADIRPFEGVRYNEEAVGSLSDVVTPPYDVISPDEQVKYLGKHPNNIVRLILPKESPEAPQVTKYARAANCLNEWLDSGVLVRDDAPSFYAVEQEYEVAGERKKRLGFSCLVRIEDYDKKTVLPHENILAKPMDDRLNLLRSTKTNFDSVFGLYSDSDVDAILRKHTMRQPDATAVDKDGVFCTLWKISEKEDVDRITSIMADKSILIADGHHRYAAALTYRNEMREKCGTTNTDAPFEFVMMTLVSLEDPGLVILPTHRVIRNLEGFDCDMFISELADFFEIDHEPKECLEESLAKIGASGSAFGLYIGGDNSYVIKLRPNIAPEKVIEGPGSVALKRLDVSILHSMILEKLLGIGTQQLAAQSNLAYKREVGDAIAAVDSGEFQMAFLMNPTKVEEVKEVAAAGDKMPQKSTFFYPKLITGLLLRVMKD